MCLALKEVGFSVKQGQLCRQMKRWNLSVRKPLSQPSTVLAPSTLSTDEDYDTVENLPWNDSRSSLELSTPYVPSIHGRDAFPRTASESVSTSSESVNETSQNMAPRVDTGVNHCESASDGGRLQSLMSPINNLSISHTGPVINAQPYTEHAFSANDQVFSNDAIHRPSRASSRESLGTTWSGHLSERSWNLDVMLEIEEKTESGGSKSHEIVVSPPTTISTRFCCVIGGCVDPASETQLFFKSYSALLHHIQFVHG